MRTKRLSKGGKGEARAVEEKKRKAAEKKIEVEKVAKDELELFVGGIWGSGLLFALILT